MCVQGTIGLVGWNMAWCIANGVPLGRGCWTGSGLIWSLDGVSLAWSGGSGVETIQEFFLLIDQKHGRAWHDIKRRKMGGGSDFLRTCMRLFLACGRFVFIVFLEFVVLIFSLCSDSLVLF